MKLVADPRNPAQYLAACGLFELAGNRDPELTACWIDDGFLIEGLSEAALKKLVTGFAHAELVPDEAWTGKDATRPFVITNTDVGIRMRMDWWEQRNGRDKSLWKCFAANQTALKTTQNLLGDCRDAVDGVSPTNLLQLSQHRSGRFGFDPRSAYKAIDVGFSPNDFEELKEVPTYSFTEIFAMVALQRWPFQPGHDSCRYYVWSRPVTLPLARLHAVASTNVALEFFRVMRGKGLSCFTYSRPIRATKEIRS